MTNAVVNIGDTTYPQFYVPVYYDQKLSLEEGNNPGITNRPEEKEVMKKFAKNVAKNAEELDAEFAKLREDFAEQERLRKKHGNSYRVPKGQKGKHILLRSWKSMLRKKEKELNEAREQMLRKALVDRARNMVLKRTITNECAFRSGMVISGLEIC